MSDAHHAALLATWLSPGYPVGAFAWSHGLETAVAEGYVVDAASFRDWAEDCLRHGAGRSDAILLAHAWRDPDDNGPADLAAALTASKERRAETLALGAAFAAATAAAWGPALSPAAYPVVLGRAAKAHGAPLEMTVTMALLAFASNLSSAAVRLVPLGQSAAQAALASLLPVAHDVARQALTAPLSDLGGAAFRADICAMRHETHEPRLFRS
ncbi:MAG: urease accessory protein [Paracoccaceae bacterium]|jgi:urease accessory protein